MIKSEQFNHSTAWRVVSEDVDMLGSYETVIAYVYKPMNLVVLCPCFDYSPTTSKQLTQMLWQWYSFNSDAKQRKAIRKQSIVNGCITGEVFTVEDRWGKKYRIQYNTDTEMGKVGKRDRDIMHLRDVSRLY